MRTVYQVGMEETEEKIVELEELVRNDIQHRIYEFEKRTGLKVRDINCQFMDCRNLSDENKYHLRDVDITIAYNGMVIEHGKRVL
jgi:hypothetical protein